MKHLKVFENKKKDKIVTDYLREIFPTTAFEDFQLMKITPIDLNGILKIIFYGNIDKTSHSNFSLIMSILTNLNIEWKFSIGGGYIDISFSDENKIDLFIDELRAMVESSKFNL